jgi:tetratricopeptide (TPR) repeat protein
MAKKDKNKSMYQKYHISKRFLIFVFCLMLLPLNLLNFLSGTVSADSDNMVDYRLDNDAQNNTAITNEDIRTSLWQTNISPVEEQKQQVQKDELKSLIEQLNSIELSLPDQSNEVYEVNTIPASEEPEITAPKVDSSKQTIQNNNNSNTGFESITEQTILKLKKLSEKPEEVDNPYEIGNTLYLSNNVGEAAAFYKEALRRKKPDDMSSADDRAWLLFQTGNSLRTIDMIAAADYYAKLLTEYPNSPWADIARVQSGIISWYTKDKPDELLKEYKH